MRKILIYIENKGNEQLLCSLLEERYEIVKFHKDEILNEKIDLCIIDGLALKQIEELVAVRKKTEHPIFFPVMAVISKRDVNLITKQLLKSIDKLVTTPIQRLEFQARVEILMRTRLISLELEEKNNILKKEAFERKKAEDEIVLLNKSLEKKIYERTVELEKINVGLSNEIMERKLAGVAPMEAKINLERDSFDIWITAEKDSFITENFEEKDINIKRLLIAEDDEVSRNIIVTMLKKKGYEVVTVKNGNEAVEIFDKGEFDLILMDINMPYLDGFSATTQIMIREKYNNKHTPIIAMTAHTLIGDKEKCINAEMDDYISKPINLNKIMDIIQKYAKSENNNKKNNRDFFNETVFNLMEASDIDRATCEELINDFNIHTVKMLKNIEKHITENNLKEAGILLHQLKGSAGNIRAKEISSLALMAEKAIEKLDNEMLVSCLKEIEASLMKLM